MSAHPLQNALKRAEIALFTVTDLLEIADRRRKPNARPDARQDSLYRAIVLASIGALEEAREALILEAVNVGDDPGRKATAESRVPWALQNPSPKQIRKVMGAHLSFDPTPFWRVRLSTSLPALRRRTVVGDRVSHELWTKYDQVRSWEGEQAASVVDRFVKIRHAFAHQDSSKGVLETGELDLLLEEGLCDDHAARPNDVDFVERLNATCAVRVFAAPAQGADPVRDWRPHRPHAINAMLCTMGVVSSTADALADHLERSAGLSRSAHQPLTLTVTGGEWTKSEFFDPLISPCQVRWNVTKYAPLSRKRGLS